MSETLYREDIAEMVAERTGLTKRMASEVVQVTLDCISERVLEGYNVQFCRFGTFKPRVYKERTITSVLKDTGTLSIPNRHSFKFVPSSVWKKVANQQQ